MALKTAFGLDDLHFEKMGVFSIKALAQKKGVATYM